MGKNGSYWSRNGRICILFNAARAGKNALCIATVSDQLVKKQFLSAEERQLSFDEMLTVALEAAITL